MDDGALSSGRLSSIVRRLWSLYRAALPKKRMKASMPR
jgi:hypothetical protein